MAQRWMLPSYGGIDALEWVHTEVDEPAAGEVRIRVAAAGVNPSDAKMLAGGWNADPALLPMGIGQEVAGIITAIGPDTGIATGDAAVGDRVVAFKVAGGFATELVVRAEDVFAIPDAVDDVVAAGLLHVGVVAAELLHLAGATEGDTLLVHGGAGSVGSLVLQLAQRAGVQVIATASPANQTALTRFGATPTTYGDGLADRVRVLAPTGVDAAIDAAGTDEALVVSLELVADRSRIATLAPGRQAHDAGVGISAGAAPASIAYRMPQRARILSLAASGDLILPVAATFPLAQAPAALRLVATGHAGGKVVLRG